MYHIFFSILIKCHLFLPVLIYIYLYYTYLNNTKGEVTGIWPLSCEFYKNKTRLKRFDWFVEYELLQFNGTTIV